MADAMRALSTAPCTACGHRFILAGRGGRCATCQALQDGVEPAAPPSFIDIVFDGPPGHDAGRFIEVEDPSGKSVNAGEWIDRGNGQWALRIVEGGGK